MKILKWKKCPHCGRVSWQNPLRRVSLGTIRRKSFVDRGTYSVFRRRSYQAWREWTEKTFRIWRLDYSCRRCGQMWSEKVETLESARRFREELPAEEFPFSE